MRRGESLGLRWRDLDLVCSTVAIEQQIVPAQGGAAIAPLKTARSRRVITIDPATVSALESQRERQQLERSLVGSNYEDRDLIFAGERGAPRHPTTVTARFATLRKRHGLPPGTIHTLRHSAVTALLAQGVPLHVVGARVGDAPSTLLDIYSHLLPVADHEAATLIAASVSNP